MLRGFMLAIFIVPCCAHAVVSASQSRLMRVMDRVSPAQCARLFMLDRAPLPTPRRPEVASAFTAHYRAQVANKGSLDFEVVTPLSFALKQQSIQKKGFWMLMTPNPPGQPLATGHTAIAIGDSVFNRLSDDLGSEAMRSIPIENAAAALMQSNDTPFLVAQFYELSDSSAAALEKFYHDRVWQYHRGADGWRTSYDRLPLSPKTLTPNCENCSLFSWSFLDPKWTLRAPELRDVQSEVGDMLIDQIPLNQLHNNTKSPAYRATLIVSKSPDVVKQMIENNSFGEDAAGAQTLFHDFKNLSLPGPGP
ncbi:MAG: hypothetical protein ABIR96_12315 [Bdellovibrionota bacterium]